MNLYTGIVSRLKDDEARRVWLQLTRNLTDDQRWELGKVIDHHAIGGGLIWASDVRYGFDRWVESR